MIVATIIISVLSIVVTAASCVLAVLNTRRWS